MPGSEEREVATVTEDLVRVLMGRLWDAAEYPSQAFEPAWREWWAEQRTPTPGGRERELAEIVGAVADELCRTRPFDPDPARPALSA